MIWGRGNPEALASSTYCRFTSARLAPVPVRIKEGGDAPSRRHSRHPSRPRRRRDDWGVGNPVALASSTYCRFTSARLAPAPVRIKEGGDAPPAVILGTPVVHAEGGTTGVSGIQWLLQVAPTVVSPQRVLLQPQSESKKAGGGSKALACSMEPMLSKRSSLTSRSCRVLWAPSTRPFAGGVWA